MLSVKVVSAYVPLPVLDMDRATYMAMGERMTDAVAKAGVPSKQFLDYPLEQCWLHKVILDNPQLQLADKGHYPERFANPADLMLSNIVQHQRTTWAILALEEDPTVDVVVWLNYNILKQGAFTGKPVTEQAITEFVERVKHMDPNEIPFPGIWDKGPIDQNGGPNWRFCGSTHIWPVKFLTQIHRKYVHVLRNYMQRNGTVPNDLPIWAEVEATSGLPFKWYRANHDATQLTHFPAYTGATPLCVLATKYGTDKRDPAKYTPIYYDLLKDRPVTNVLEIGICTHRDIPNHRPGASLWMWADFFPDAHVHGIDIEPPIKVDHPRISAWQGDQSRPDHLRAVADQVGPFDLIVDDGSHNPIHQLVSMQTLLPYLSETGVYVIEDIGNWQYPTTKPEDLAAQVPMGFRARIANQHPYGLLVVERCA